MPDKTCFVICPFCGGRVQKDPGYQILWYICQECDYQGSFIIEADTLEDIKKLKEYIKTHKGDNKVPVSNGFSAPDSPGESSIKKNSFKNGKYNVFGEEYHLNVSGEKYYIDQSGKKYKRCPLCLEILDMDNKKCRFCGFDPNERKINWPSASLIILLIVGVLVNLVLFLGKKYADYDYWPILDNISLIFILALFAILIIYVIYIVIIAIKSIKQ